MSRFFTALCTLLLAVMLTPSTTNADPVVVTGGFIFARRLVGPEYVLVANNFVVIGAFGEHGNTGPEFCAPCVAGNVIPINSTYIGTSQGSAIINGTLFPNLTFEASFSLTGDPVVVPNSTSAVTLTAPFLFSGVMRGCPTSDRSCQTPVFSTQMVGSGIAIVQLNAFLDSQGQTFFEFSRVTYVFTNVPEPASVLLLAGGLAALGAAKFKRPGGKH